MAWAFGVGKSGYGLCRFVFKAGQHLMHTIGAKRLKEPLATYPSIDIDRPKVESKDFKITYIYGPGNSLYALKARQVSSVKTGPLILNYD